MKKETRANLIFLIVILAISLPAAVVLFKKKLDPAAPAMFMPDYVKRKLPYMAPQMTPDTEVTRVVPEATGRWVEQVQREHDGGRVLFSNRMPLISVDRLVQVLDVRDNILQLLVWNPDYEVQKIEIEIDGNRIECKIGRNDLVLVPEQIRKELMYAGISRPPHEVKWVEAGFESNMTEKQPRVLFLTYRQGTEKGVSRVNLFTNSGAAGN